MSNGETNPMSNKCEQDPIINNGETCKESSQMQSSTMDVGMCYFYISAELPNMLNLKPSFFRPLDNISFLLLSNIAFYLKCVSEKMQPTSIRDSCGNDNI